MRTNFVYLLIMLVCLSGCLELGTDSDKTAPKGECQLTSSTTSFNRYGSQYNYSLNYTFTSTGLLSRISSADTSALNIRFVYDAQNRLVSEQFHPYTWASTYNEQGQLAKQTRNFEFAEGRYETYFLEHYYDIAGKLTESRYYAAEATGDVLIYTYNYSYTDGKMSGIEQISAQDSRNYKATFTTDDSKKQLPVLPMHMLYMFRDENLPIMGMLPGNITSFTGLQSDGASADFESYTATITYNESGYPTAIHRTYAGGGKESTLYTYNCK